MSNQLTPRYTGYGGTESERVETLGMFSPKGTDAVADLLENIMDGATVSDIMLMHRSIASNPATCDVSDTACRDILLASLPAGSLEQHTMCEALFIEFACPSPHGTENEHETRVLIARARVRKAN